MKKLWLIVVAVLSFGITACTNEVDFDTYISDLMYVYDDVETSMEELSSFQSLEELLIIYSDLSVKLGVAQQELELIGKYGSDKFLYNSAYKYIANIQALYQNEFNELVMLYAKDKQKNADTEAIIAEIKTKLSDYDALFEEDLGDFIAKYEKIDE